MSSGTETDRTKMNDDDLRELQDYYRRAEVK
jgi:hypothetical protein